MLDHISIPVSNIERSAHFYDNVLATLGLERRKERPGSIGYGPSHRKAPIFWIHLRQEEGYATSGVGLHISFQASTRQSVDNFHQTGLQYGGRDAGRPGLRPQYTAPFYGAFLFDLDGFKIEAVCRVDEGSQDVM